MSAFFGVCCAYLPTSETTAAGVQWQLVCNLPYLVPAGVDAADFPVGTAVSNQRLIPGVMTQCVGRFPFLFPNLMKPYKLPNGPMVLPDGLSARFCPQDMPHFFQGVGSDGAFVVQCTAATHGPSSGSGDDMAVAATAANAATAATATAPTNP